MRSTLLCLFATCLAFVLPAHADEDPAAAFVGKYEFVSGEKRSDMVISIEIKAPEGDPPTISLEAGFVGGQGAAPSGEGEGYVNESGIFQFDYSDSFENRGKGTFRETDDGYVLNIKITDVQESRCLVFYGKHVLTPVEK